MATFYVDLNLDFYIKYKKVAILIKIVIFVGHFCLELHGVATKAYL